MFLIMKDTPSWRVMKNSPSREVIYFLVIKIAGHEKTQPSFLSDILDRVFYVYS